MAIESDGVAPYGTPGGVIDFINRFRDRGVPSPFTDEVLIRAGLAGAGSSAQRIRQSLRLLDLIDESNNPTDHLRGLARATTEEFQDRLAEIVRAAYAPIFQFVDPSQDSPERVRDAFRGNQPHAQQERMANFFMALCQAAGIIDEIPRSTPVATRAPTRERPARSRQAQPDPSSDSTQLVPSIRPQAASVPPALAGLLAEALPPSRSWTLAERNRFRAAFDVILDFSIRVVENNVIPGGDEKK